MQVDLRIAGLVLSAALATGLGCAGCSPTNPPVRVEAPTLPPRTPLVATSEGITLNGESAVPCELVRLEVRREGGMSTAYLVIDFRTGGGGGYQARALWYDEAGKVLVGSDEYPQKGAIPTSGPLAIRFKGPVPQARSVAVTMLIGVSQP